MSNLAKKSIDTVKNFGQNSIKKLVDQPNDIFFSIVILIISFLVIFIIILYIITQVTKKKSNINDIDRSYTVYDANTNSEHYKSFSMIGNGDYNYPTKDGNPGKSTGRLCDYFIASSYNSCCSGDFKNDYVDIEALKKVIKRGARLLDFQLFYINDNIVVSASSDETEFIKGTYNYLYLTGTNGVLETIKREAFSPSNNFRNTEDPLFINLRIQSERSEIYDKLTQMFNLTLGDKLLDVGYGFEGTKSSIDIGKTNINNFKNKIIIICDQKNKNYIDTSFYELINLTPNRDDGPLIRYRNYEINFAEERSNILDKTKKKIVMVYPDNTDINNNKDPENLFNLGCSMILMNYQKLDSNLTKYLNTFGQSQEYSNIAWEPSAFMLKKDSLREMVDIVGNDDQECIHEDLNKYIIDITDGQYGYRTKILKTSVVFETNGLPIDTNDNGSDLHFKLDSDSTICNSAGTNGINVKIYDGKHLENKGCYDIAGNTVITNGILDVNETNNTVIIDNNTYLQIPNYKILLNTTDDDMRDCGENNLYLHKFGNTLKDSKWEKFII